MFRSSRSACQIAELPAGAGGGVIGITRAPGTTHSDSADAHLADLDAIAAWNAAIVVTLIERQELAALGLTALGAEVRRRHMQWEHWPIADYGVPDATFEAAWPAFSSRLRTLLACGGRVPIHCKGGRGRAGMVAARLLVEQGQSPRTAMDAVRAARPNAVETEAQHAWVARGQATPLPAPDTVRVAARDRAIGALLGLAVGDAVGASLEFQPKPHFAVLDDMTGGGPHGLARGQWTDDTAMALALADSLLAAPGFDADDVMRRFVDWYRRGAYSCTGTCFDIGIQTRAALERFETSGEPFIRSPDPRAQSNGALMRLAPVALRCWRNREECLDIADAQTRTTHGSPATRHASTVFADLLCQAIAGVPLADLLASREAEVEGGWRNLPRAAIEGSGHVVRSLQAALWSVARTTDFRAAILLAANLGDDADTTAAIAGQLAGAVYGRSGIPADWLAALAWRERLEDTAARLFDAGCPEPETRKTSA